MKQLFGPQGWAPSRALAFFMEKILSQVGVEPTTFHILGSHVRHSPHPPPPMGVWIACWREKNTTGKYEFIRWSGEISMKIQKLHGLVGCISKSTLS